MPICSKCEHQFQLTADHKGYANVCPVCSDGDVSRLVAKVAWSGKHTVEIEITADRRSAAYFNGAQRRWGAGVTRSLTEPKEPKSEANYSKKGSGAEGGAGYTTSLGEKRTVRR
jgi:DNA-directed RNA polymerase subunit RPC12/RpoP